MDFLNSHPQMAKGIMDQTDFSSYTPTEDLTLENLRMVSSEVGENRKGKPYILEQDMGIGKHIQYKRDFSFFIQEQSHQNRLVRHKSPSLFLRLSK